MAFSSFREFLFMASIDSWRVPRSGYLKFGNRKKSQGSKSGEYGGWEMTFVSCLAKNSVTIRQKIKIFRYESGGNALHTQKTKTTMWKVDPQEMLRASATSLMPTRRFSRTIFFTFSMLSSLTEVDGRLTWSKFSTSWPLLNALCHPNTWVLDRVEYPKHFCNIFNDSVAAISLETHTASSSLCLPHSTNLWQGSEEEAMSW